MSILFNASFKGNEELTNLMDDILNITERCGSFQNNEISIIVLEDGKFKVTDKENGEVTIIERADDGNYDLYPDNIDDNNRKQKTKCIEGSTKSKTHALKGYVAFEIINGFQKLI